MDNEQRMGGSNGSGSTEAQQPPATNFAPEKDETGLELRAKEDAKFQYTQLRAWGMYFKARSLLAEGATGNDSGELEKIRTAIMSSTTLMKLRALYWKLLNYLFF